MFPAIDLGDRPWTAVELTSPLPVVPTMISTEERELLYWLARDYWTQAGRIVDAGAFLGGSATALAAGVRDRPVAHRGERPPIVSLDDFTVEGYMVDGGFFPGRVAGDDFSDLFAANLGDLAPLCEIRAGDIADLQWDDEPIEVLFLDVLKSWPVNDLITRRLFRHLIPGRSIVIQQDQNYACAPWISITMEQFGDRFERLDALGYGSVVHRLARPLPDLDTMTPSRDLRARRKFTLMDRAMARESGQNRAMLGLSRVVLVRYCYGREAADAELESWLSSVEMNEALELALEYTRVTLAYDDTIELSHHAVRRPALHRARWGRRSVRPAP